VALSLLALLLTVGDNPVRAQADDGGGNRVPARVVSNTDDQVVFRVDLVDWTVTPSPALAGTERIRIPGFINLGVPGEPRLPSRTYFVGLPPDGTWRLSWRVVESVSLGRLRLEPNPFPGAQEDAELGVIAVERYRMDDGVYSAFRSPETVSSDDEAWIRRQRVLPVRVRPVTYDPVTGEASLATSIEVTVSFTRGRGRGEEPARMPVVESAEWEEVFSRMLVNSSRARSWRRPLRTPADRTSLSGTGAVQTGPMVKLRVERTGIHKVTADALIAAGFPSGQPVDGLRLLKRGYDDDALAATETDVAFKVSEHASGTPGVFDGGDVLVFYGLRLRDDDSHADRDQLYTDYNVYWLAAAAGTVMADRALVPGYLSADTADASFPVSRHFADDGAFYEDTKAPGTDYYFYNDGTELEVNFPFELDSVKPATNLSLTAMLHGATYIEIRRIETRLVNAVENRVMTPSLAVSNKDIVRYQYDLPAASLVPGTNTFRYKRIDSSTQSVRVLLNWLEVSYEALYRAHQNSLTFNTANLSGDTTISVTNLTDTDLSLFDVTDPIAPVNCVLEPSLFTNVGGGWALSFRDAITSQKEYVLVPQSGMIEVQSDDIVLDTPSDIIVGQGSNPVDVLVVSHRDFLADVTGPDSYDMHDWVRYRRAQGKRVLMVDVEDVYDEFNGGVVGTRGIDRFVRHFFELGNAGYVLLVGDGCEDHKQTYDDSNPDYIPSHCRTEYVGSGGFNEDEVVTMDKWFVKLPNATGTVDPYPDLVIGRFPVGSMSELQRILYKVFDYESPQASDFWRRRMIIVADDGWGEGGGGSSCWWNETGFQSGQEICAQITENAHPGTFDVIRFYMSDEVAKYHSTQNPTYGFCEGPNTMFLLRQQTRADATVSFLNELSQGATLVTIQAHMNRSLVTHEWLFVTLSTAPNGNKDHLRCNNRGKPFVIYGMGCHFSDYALHREMARLPLNNPNGDAFAEQLLFQNNEGAVSTYGSSGFEYLSEVNAFMEQFSGIWFYEAPYEDKVVDTQGRWVLGPMMFLVEAVMTGPPYGQRRPVDRYHILGDPLLRIDAGPPLIEATVNGSPFQSGDNVISVTDSIEVVANIRDENAIDDIRLLIDGEDASNTMTVTPLLGEPIPRARAYEVRFKHELRLNAYEIVLRALQAPDTVSGQYHMAAEFVFNVPSNLDVTVNGRVVTDGDVVPAKGNYRIQLNFPVFVPSSEISVRIDDEDITGLTFTHPSEEDSTTWVIQFSKTLPDGNHTMVVTVGTAELDPFTLVVKSDVGLRNVVNYPNPFTDQTQFLYTSDVEIENGTIDVFTVSGKKIVRLEIPPDARNPGQNAVFWNGRDAAGDEIANGVYLYVIRVTQRGQDSTIRGKLARMK
jgi:hypothetical protein